ncbi:MAG: hypothetical protein M3441_23935 [Chloroflexota bacterium]|nr:hypothetical protein [Chloroflexota bacterium]
MWHRLGRDDFERTSELRRGFGSDSREWGVCREYLLREVTEDGRPVQYIVPKYYIQPYQDDNWTMYSPLQDTPDLFLRFARLHERSDSVEAILDWVHRYGVLGHGSGWSRTAPQSVKDFREALEEAAGVLAMYEAVLNGDAQRAKSLVLEEFPLVGPGGHLIKMLREAGVPVDDWDRAGDTSKTVEEHFDGDYLDYALDLAVAAVNEMVKETCYPSLDMGYELHRRPSDVRTGWSFKSLLGAMYLQMYWLMGSGGEVTRCRYCGRIISLARPSPDARKVRQDKSFCDDACRQRHHYHNRTKPKRQGKQR